MKPAAEVVSELDLIEESLNDAIGELSRKNTKSSFKKDLETLRTNLHSRFDIVRNDIILNSVLVKSQAKLQDNLRRTREQVLLVKQRRAEIQQELYELEVNYHKNEEKRLNQESMHFFISDFESFLDANNEPVDEISEINNNNNNNHNNNNNSNCFSNIKSSNEVVEKKNLHISPVKAKKSKRLELVYSDEKGKDATEKHTNKRKLLDIETMQSNFMDADSEVTNNKKRKSAQEEKEMISNLVLDGGENLDGDIIETVALIRNLASIEMTKNRLLALEKILDQLIGTSNEL